MTALTEPELSAFLAANPTWHLTGGAIVRQWTFPGFPGAIAFVNRVATLAETAGHHPDIDIRYNRVRLALVTHDAGGITSNDTSLAAQLDQIPAVN
jgi:4a-hydroxytetrahydrobiopterin dehydratase